MGKVISFANQKGGVGNNYLYKYGSIPCCYGKESLGCRH